MTPSQSSQGLNTTMPTQRSSSYDESTRCQFFMGHTMPITFLADAEAHRNQQATLNSMHNLNFAQENISYPTQPGFTFVDRAGPLYTLQQESGQDFRYMTPSTIPHFPSFNFMSYPPPVWNQRYEQAAVYPVSHHNVCILNT